MKSIKICANAEKCIDNLRKCVYINDESYANAQEGDGSMYGNLIVAMRLKRVSIEEIAKFLGIHRNSVSNKINGNSKFTIEEAFKIHKRFFQDMNMEELFTKTKNAG